MVFHVYNSTIIVITTIVARTFPVPVLLPVPGRTFLPLSHRVPTPTLTESCVFFPYPALPKGGKSVSNFHMTKPSSRVSPPFE